MRHFFDSFVRKILFLVLGFSVINCHESISSNVSTSDWKAVEKSHFSILLPTTFEEREVEGTDTNVYQFAAPNIILTIEFGLYASLPENLQNEANFERKKVSVNGQSGELISYSSLVQNNDSKRFLVLNFSNVSFSKNGLTAWVQYEHVADRGVALAILNSLRIH